MNEETILPEGKMSPWDIIKGSLMPSDVEFHAVMVDDDLAAKMLVHNREPQKGKESTNRKSSPQKEREYAEAMLAEEWFLSPQPIIFRKADGHGETELIDGQQRLKALRLAARTNPGVQIPLYVALNAEDVKLVLDIGKARQPGDFLRMAGEANSGPLAAAIKMLYCYLEEDFKSISLWQAVKLSPVKRSQFLAAHVGLRQGIADALAAKTMAMPYVLGVLHELIRAEHGAFKAAEFVLGLARGLDTGGDARWKLREFLSAQKISGYKWNGFEQLGVIITAANCWLLGTDDSLDLKPVHKRLAAKTLTAFPRLVSAKEIPFKLQ